MSSLRYSWPKISTMFCKAQHPLTEESKYKLPEAKLEFASIFYSRILHVIHLFLSCVFRHVCLFTLIIFSNNSHRNFHVDFMITSECSFIQIRYIPLGVDTSARRHSCDTFMYYKTKFIQCMFYFSPVFSWTIITCQFLFSFYFNNIHSVKLRKWATDSRENRWTAKTEKYFINLK